MISELKDVSLQPRKAQFSSREATKLVNDFMELDTSAEGGLHWITDDLEALAHDPEVFPHFKEATKILARNDWLLGYWGIFKPITPLRDALSTQAEKVNFVASGLRRRERMIRAVERTYGSTHFQVLTSGNQPFHLEVDPEVQMGGNRFNLFDGKGYENSVRVRLGMVDIDYFDKDILLINLIQDEWAILNSDNKVIEDGEAKNSRTIITKGQRKIREWVNQGRVLPNDIYQRESPGLEEVLIQGVLETMVGAGILKPSTKVIIAYPEVTNWGDLNGDQFEEFHGTKLALAKTLRKELSGQSKEVIDRVKGAVRRRWPASSQEDFVETTYELALREQGHRRYLSRFLAELVVGAIPDSLKPAEKELEQLGYFDGFSPLGFGHFINLMATKTPAYLSTFHAYRTAFSDLATTEEGFGRVINRAEILKLPFVQNTKLVPLA